jgi:hypothetical protein
MKDTGKTCLRGTAVMKGGSKFLEPGGDSGFAIDEKTASHPCFAAEHVRMPECTYL